jgi:hypothetical protein
MMAGRLVCAQGAPYASGVQPPPLPPPPDGVEGPPRRVPMPSGLRAAIVIGIVGGVVLLALVIWLVVVVVTNPMY